VFCFWVMLHSKKEKKHVKNVSHLCEYGGAIKRTSFLVIKMAMIGYKYYHNDKVVDTWVNLITNSRYIYIRFLNKSFSRFNYVFM
jgi:hypothetical protein